MALTNEQADAIHIHDQNLVVVAGAGSGKTHVLVERYINLLEQNADWSLNVLVAITFTREAALEMRDRVRQKLEDRVRRANEAEQQRWSDLLAQMDSARINTIHGLCSTILRANAAEAGVDPAFEVMDEVSADILLKDIIDVELQRLVASSQEDTALLFTEYTMHEIRDVLANPELLAIDLDPMPDDAAALYQAWQEEFVRVYDTMRNALLNRAELLEAYDYLNGVLAPEADKLADVLHQVMVAIDAFANGDMANSYAAAAAIPALVNLRGGSAKAWGSKEEVEEVKAHLRVIRAEMESFIQMVGQPPNDFDSHAAQMLVRWYRLLAAIQRQYRQTKQEQGLLDFNDLEQRTAALLADDATDVRRRYQGLEFKQLLVDEFQDTNHAQWQIVKSLVDLHNDTALFVVGDMKQSIYGFRGADVTVFGEVRREIRTLPGGAGRELTLSHSFRSHPALIALFNRMFNRLLVQNQASPVRDYEIAFDPQIDAMHAHRDPLDPATDLHYQPIELYLLRAKQDHLEKRITAPDRRIWEAYLIAERLHQLRRDAAPIHDKPTNQFRPFDYGDAAILFQSTAAINDYEGIFKTQGLPFVTVAGRGYYNRQEVWDVLNLLKALHNPSDSLSLAAALRSPMFAFSDDMLLACRLLDDRAHSLWEAINQDDIPVLSEREMALIHRARDILYDLHGFAGRVTISELLRQSLAMTGYLATLTGLPDGARLRRNIEKLIDIAEQSGKITLGEFSHYLNDLTAREVREGEAALDASGAVRLMTVHASKGLEFPVVILADASWQRTKSGGDILQYDPAHKRLVCKAFDPEERTHRPSFPYRYASYLQQLRDEAERKRLFYVAATRARDCLIISGEVQQDDDGSWSSNGWMQQAIEVLDAANASAGAPVADTGVGRIRLYAPPMDADLPQKLRGGQQVRQWPTMQTSPQGQMPPLMRPVMIPQDQLLEHIGAAQLADIGGVRYAAEENKDYYLQNVRRKILDDAPAQIRDSIRTRIPRYRARQIGDVVHEALRYWRFPQTTDRIDDILRSYAWQQHITDERDIRDVVVRAHHLLDVFQQSEIYREMQAVKEAGKPFFAELPFIYRTGKRILHGVIDALFQREDGTWAVVDYKTGYVPHIAQLGKNAAAVQHAQRYHLQIGAYAAAVQEEIGVTPQTYIHYIQYNETVEIATATWQAEIANLENYIGDIVGSRDD